MVEVIRDILSGLKEYKIRINVEKDDINPSTKAESYHIAFLYRITNGTYLIQDIYINTAGYSGPKTSVNIDKIYIDFPEPSVPMTEKAFISFSDKCLDGYEILTKCTTAFKQIYKTIILDELKRRR